MLIPVLHRVLVKADTVEESDEVLRRAKALGLHIELDKREQAAVETGVVVAIGETAFRDYGAEGILSTGDKVYFAKYAGKQVTDVDGSKLLMLNDEDVVAIIKEDK